MKTKKLAAPFQCETPIAVVGGTGGNGGSGGGKCDR